MISLAGVGQDQSLSYDERGKFIHYEVVEQSGVSKVNLSARANRFFKQKAKLLKMTSKVADTIMQAEGKFIINKTALVLNRPSGEVKYNFYIECRDDKYRFWLTDFVFIPYQRDRYGNFVASTTVGTPLENEPGKLNAAEWKGYINNTGKEAEILTAQFKESMADKQEIKPATKSRETISTKKW
ncbi:DUF4468 domain-containing protein [Pedobacter frigoris]|uniref:DUF4468 domain-containing protein n=2 Tax=Pedobacter frigoris TaxID=2571272 RepID=A0A4U1CQ88_9SPHI|nr:DUF4468 domain-containing protein [Pedobacter frigoris]